VGVLFSMTGYGEANYHSDALSVAIELRAVNNRYLKVSLRAAEPYNLLEPEFEKVVRRVVRRGTIQVHLRCQRQYAAQDFQVNAVALRSYVTQVRKVAAELGLADGGQGLLGQALALPGVVPEPATSSFSLEEDWPVLEKVLQKALERMQAMRQEEGRAMAQELLQIRDHIAGELDRIRARMPAVTEAYRDRLFERLRSLLVELDVQIDRKELIRETNTIGSKASDVEISRHVVEIKGDLEKIRELVQNVE
jgi:uncharacterized protein (TIGR00255 family)